MLHTMELVFDEKYHNHLTAGLERHTLWNNTTRQIGAPTKPY